MAFPILAVVCFVIHLYAPTVVFATSFKLYNDGACESLYANVQTGTNAGDGECGQVKGVYSASVTSLDPGCYLTLYSDYCSSNATAVRISTCTTLDGFLEIASYSVDCPSNNGALEGYTTSLAAAAQTTTQSPTPSESTSSQEPPQDSTTSSQSPSFSESTSSSQESPQDSTTSTQSSSFSESTSSSQEPPQDSTASTQSPSFSESMSSSQEPQAVPTPSSQSSSTSLTSTTSPTSFTSRLPSISPSSFSTGSPSPEISTSKSRDVQPSSSPASASTTIATSPLPSSLPSSSSSTQSSTPSSSPSQTSLANKGGLSTTNQIIIGVTVSVGCSILLVLGFSIYRWHKQRGVPNQTSSLPPAATENVATPAPEMNHRPHRRMSGSSALEDSQGSMSPLTENGQRDERGDRPMADMRSNNSDFSSLPTDPQRHLSFS